MANSVFRPGRRQHDTLADGPTVPRQQHVEPDHLPFVDEDERPRGFREAAESTAKLVWQSLGVDHVMILRIFEDWIISLAAAPDPEMVFGQQLDLSAAPGVSGAATPPSAGGTSGAAGTSGARRTSNARSTLQVAVEQVSRRLRAAGSAGAGLYTREGALIGVLVVAQRASFADPPRVGQVLGQYAGVLSTLLEREMADVAVQREEDVRAMVAFHDSFSKMPDRRAWGLMLRHEQQRARNLGHPSAVLVVDVGMTNSSRILRRIVEALRESAGSAPALCRLDARLWGVIVTGHHSADLEGLVEDLAEDLAAAGAQPAIGLAERELDGELADAWSLADERMFTARRQRRRVVGG